MMDIKRLRLPFGIATQIVALASLSVLLGAALVIAAVILIFDPPNEQESPAYGVVRVIDITHFVRAAKDADAVEGVLSGARSSGIKAEIVPLAALVPARPGAKDAPWTSLLARRQIAALRDITVLNGVRYANGPPTQIIVQVDAERALVFDDVPRPSILPLLLKPTVAVLIIIVFMALLLSIYVARAIIRPLSDVARAATAFGRSPDPHESLTGRGPREIVQVSEALNEMRARIRDLLDDRTRMLAAISHDLRTPLTRLRLRSERIAQLELRNAMLRDIDQVSRMLDEKIGRAHV